jgi:hypothetical protein
VLLNSLIEDKLYPIIDELRLKSPGLSKDEILSVAREFAPDFVKVDVEEYEHNFTLILKWNFSNLPEWKGYLIDKRGWSTGGDSDNTSEKGSRRYYEKIWQRSMR